MKSGTIDIFSERQTTYPALPYQTGSASLLRLRRSQFLSLLVLWMAQAGASAAADWPDAPPWWPDQIYAANGCYLSASAYVARLASTYPAADATTYTVEIPSCRKHTIAVVTWNGVKYGRDQYIGVFKIGDSDPQTSFVATLRRWWQAKRTHRYPEKRPSSIAERHAEVLLARQIMSFAKTELVPVITPTGAVTILTWQTTTGELAIYEPMLGTAVGSTSASVAEAARYLLSQLTALRRG